MKRLVIACLSGFLFCTAAAAEIPLQCQSAMLLDMTSGKVLYAKEPDKRIQPASITKVLTLFLVRESVDAGQARWTDRVRISRKAARTKGTRMFLKAGSTVSLGELAQGMAVVSANDASVAVAEYLGKGKEGRFIRRMNLKARELGMRDSVFKTPNGLPAKGQYTTARDIMKLSTAYLERFPESLDLHRRQTYTYHGRTQENRNRLLGHYPGADGLKTGFVVKAGYHVTATAKRGDTRIVAVVMGARTWKQRNAEAERLLDEGFRCAAREQQRRQTASPSLMTEPGQKRLAL